MDSADLNPIESPEFTLEDTYDLLKDIKEEKQNEIDELTEAIRNNTVSALGPNDSIEHIVTKQVYVLESLEKLVKEKDPKFFSIPKSADLYSTAIQGLEDEVYNMDALLKRMQNEVASLKSDVAYLEDKKSGFEKMKEAALNATEDKTKNTYAEEYAATKHLFSDVKADLKTVIGTMFPENDGLHNFLLDLNRAQLKGGDDVYVNITPDTVYYTNFLVSTGIITFHPNDKSKAKMMDLL